MIRRSKSKRVAHGAVLDAPSEYGFVTSDSPSPPPVAAKGQPSPGGSRGPLSVLWTGLKLSIGLAVVASISVAIAWGAHRYALAEAQPSPDQTQLNDFTEAMKGCGASLNAVNGSESGEESTAVPNADATTEADAS